MLFVRPKFLYRNVHILLKEQILRCDFVENVSQQIFKEAKKNSKYKFLLNSPIMSFFV